jgi:hypothetical protein
LWSPSLALGFALVACGDAVAQESFPPTPIGGGSRVTRQVSGQIIEIEATGNVTAVVSFTEIAVRRVAGAVARTNDGTGTVTIRWTNRNRQSLVGLDTEHVYEMFEMLGPPPRRLKHDHD